MDIRGAITLGQRRPNTRPQEERTTKTTTQCFHENSIHILYRMYVKTPFLFSPPGAYRLTLAPCKQPKSCRRESGIPQTLPEQRGAGGRAANDMRSTWRVCSAASTWCKAGQVCNQLGRLHTTGRPRSLPPARQLLVFGAFTVYFHANYSLETIDELVVHNTDACSHATHARCNALPSSP